MIVEVIERRDMSQIVSYEFVVPADWQERAWAAGWRFGVHGDVSIERRNATASHEPPKVSYRLEAMRLMVLAVDAPELDDKERRTFVDEALKATGSPCLLIGLI
jgi:hypothetical protein